MTGWLHYQRHVLLSATTGLTDDQRKQRPIGTSLMSLHGLVRHLSEVERTWFTRRYGPDRQLPALYTSDAHPDADWSPLDDADWGTDLGSWRRECHESDLVVADIPLDEVRPGRRGGRTLPFSLRWTYHHMIEEYAAHNGHADLIRELVVGGSDR